MLTVIVPCLRHSCKFWCGDICEIGHKTVDNIENGKTISAGTKCKYFKREKPKNRLWLKSGNGRI